MLTELELQEVDRLAALLKANRLERYAVLITHLAQEYRLTQELNSVQNSIEQSMAWKALTEARIAKYEDPIAVVAAQADFERHQQEFVDREREEFQRIHGQRRKMEPPKDEDAETG